MKRINSIVLTVFLSIICSAAVSAQSFLHPGIDQTSADLEYMKKQVLKGEQPWKDAFERLKSEIDINVVVKSHAHVMRGPYGKPNIGGDDLSKGSNMAYNFALLWYITDDKKYANKAIEIINKWSPELWDFDYNDAKLLAGWTGHHLCNAAEILRNTNAGWLQKDQDSFTNMLMTVYYPLMRFYYPQANGNWDGAIIHSILAIAVFTDNRALFNNAIDHFLHGPVNGSIFKYVYPSGQCQESARDQAHVQLGLGEFAGAARIAYTQGVDLFSIANNRIALGYEYTAQFLTGGKPHCYGIISERAKKVRDDYEYVYRHYTSKGIDMPYSKVAADSVRPKATRNVLTAFRAPASASILKIGTPKPSAIAFPAGALNVVNAKVPDNAIIVKSGESIQKALDSAALTGGWVKVSSGLHTLPGTLKIPSGITLSGEGLGTVLFLDPASGVRDAIVNADSFLHNVTIRDLVVEGALKPETGTDPNSNRSFRSTGNRGGIILRSHREGDMKNINLINITVQNCTYNGVFITGAEGVNISGCNFSENGSSVVPGPKLQHNLLLGHCSGVVIKDSRLVTSPFGSGVTLTHCKNAKINSCEIARNAYYGINLLESSNIEISGNLIENNDRSGIMMEYLYHGCNNVSVTSNLIHYNNGFGVESYSAKDIKVSNNTYAGNGTDLKSNEKISAEKYIIME